MGEGLHERAVVFRAGKLAQGYGDLLFACGISHTNPCGFRHTLVSLERLLLRGRAGKQPGSVPRGQNCVGGCLSPLLVGARLKST
jgi:hypothetical protein